MAINSIYSDSKGDTMARKKVKLIHANTGKQIKDATEYERKPAPKHSTVGAKGKAPSRPVGRPAGTAKQTAKERRAQLTEAKRRERARKKAMGLKLVSVWMPVGNEYAEAEEAIKRTAELACEKALNGH